MEYDEYPTIQSLTESQNGQPAKLEKNDQYDPWKQEYILDTQNLSSTGHVRVISRGSGKDITNLD